MDKTPKVKGYILGNAGEVLDIKRVSVTVKQVLYDRVHGEHEHDRTLLRDNFLLRFYSEKNNHEVN